MGFINMFSLGRKRCSSTEQLASQFMVPISPTQCPHKYNKHLHHKKASNFKKLKQTSGYITCGQVTVIYIYYNG